ncbi:MAG TPA: septum formation initiator family protein [Candidatus Acidoferrum sp.]|nr:septum formation initiator family protein [Candidatus Acidoferrum sp.]
MGIGKLKKNAKKSARQEKIHDLARRYGSGLLGLLALLMIVHNVFGTHGFLAMRRTQTEIKKVKADLTQLAKDNAALAQETQALKSDPRLIEKIARDELGLARPGEIIIRIPADQQTPGQDSSPGR